MTGRPSPPKSSSASRSPVSTFPAARRSAIGFNGGNGKTSKSSASSPTRESVPTARSSGGSTCRTIRAPPPASTWWCCCARRASRRQCWRPREAYWRASTRSWRRMTRPASRKSSSIPPRRQSCTVSFLSGVRSSDWPLRRSAFTACSPMPWDRELMNSAFESRSARTLVPCDGRSCVRGWRSRPSGCFSASLEAGPRRGR